MPITSEHGRRRARFIATAVAVLLACSGAAAVAVGIASQDPAPPAPPGGQAAAPSASPTPEPAAKQSQEPDGKQPQGTDPAPDTKVQKEPAVETLDYSEPVRIKIPTIGVSSSLVDLGLDSEGVMETPEPVDKAGWFTPSPPPGIPGATVIAGHVTWDQEPMVFFKLGDLKKGDRVEVVRKDGINTVFEVTRIGSFPKDSFPTDAVYSQPDTSELRLITCGGDYDKASNRYLSNVIVWAKIVSHTAA